MGADTGRWRLSSDPPAGRGNVGMIRVGGREALRTGCLAKRYHPDVSSAREVAMSTVTKSRPSKGRGSVGGGRVLVWQGGSLWVSRATGAVEPHAHHAIQITLAPGRAVRLKVAGATEWQCLQASIVMPDQPHQFDGCGGDVALVFVEPESRAGRMLVARYGNSPLTPLDEETLLDQSRTLLQALDGKAGDERLIAVAKSIIDLLTGALPEVASVDPRITRSLEWMRARIAEPVTLAQAAGVAHLSPGRFRHLFVEQTGISFRGYLLWTRVNSAVVDAMAGQSWTAAAQNAGFADSAHLSRTCRRVFGIAPSMLDRESRD